MQLLDVYFVRRTNTALPSSYCYVSTSLSTRSLEVALLRHDTRKMKSISHRELSKNLLFLKFSQKNYQYRNFKVAPQMFRLCFHAISRKTSKFSANSLRDVFNSSRYQESCGEKCLETSARKVKYVACCSVLWVFLIISKKVNDSVVSILGSTACLTERFSQAKKISVRQ